MGMFIDAPADLAHPTPAEALSAIQDATLAIMSLSVFVQETLVPDNLMDMSPDDQASARRGADFFLESIDHIARYVAWTGLALLDVVGFERPVDPSRSTDVVVIDSLEDLGTWLAGD